MMARRRRAGACAFAGALSQSPTAVTPSYVRRHLHACSHQRGAAHQAQQQRSALWAATARGGGRGRGVPGPSSLSPKDAEDVGEEGIVGVVGVVGVQGLVGLDGERGVIGEAGVRGNTTPSTPTFSSFDAPTATTSGAGLPRLVRPASLLPRRSVSLSSFSSTLSPIPLALSQSRPRAPSPADSA